MAAVDVLSMWSFDQPDARKWEGSLRNNTGFALYQLGRYDEALVLFRSNAPLATREGNAEKLRIAWWMVAWTLRALKQNDEALAIQLRPEQEVMPPVRPTNTSSRNWSSCTR